MEFAAVYRRKIYLLGNYSLPTGSDCRVKPDNGAASTRLYLLDVQDRITDVFNLKNVFDAGLRALFNGPDVKIGAVDGNHRTRDGAGGKKEDH
jgi:hypothetical protein